MVGDNSTGTGNSSSVYVVHPNRIRYGRHTKPQAKSETLTVHSQGFQSGLFPAASDDITWRRPRSVVMVVVWSITNASIILNVFFGGEQELAWYILLLLFFVSIFAGMLLQDVKAIIIGAFEAIFLTALLTWMGMILPILVGGVNSFYQAQAVYTVSFGYMFRFFFPLVPISMAIGAVIGGFAEDWLF